MKILKCKFCRGEVNILNNDKSVNRKTKCSKCGFCTHHDPPVKNTEVFVMRKRS